MTIIQNWMAGPEQNNDNADWRHTVDTIVTYTATPQVSLALNYDYGHDTYTNVSTVWQGVAAYLKYQPNAMFAVTPRYEFFQDRDALATGVAQNLQELTLTVELKHKDGVMMRVEYRGDRSNVPYFLKNMTEATKNQNALTVGWVYSFSSKTP